MIYPINIKTEDMGVVIIGGGEVGYRKCVNFINFKTNVTVISPEFIDEFYKLDRNLVKLVKDNYKEEYINDSFIVVAATNNKEINKEIGLYCRNNSKLVNVVDSIEMSNFTTPSYVKRGDLLISISTGGKSPSLSSKIKKELEDKYDESYEEYTRVLGEVRKDIIRKYEKKSEKKEMLNRLVELSLEELKAISENYIK